MTFSPERLGSVAAAFASGAKSYAAFGAPLYAALCAGGAKDPDIIALAAHAQPGAQPVFHLLTAVHFLLLGAPDDPLAAYFATLNDPPLPAAQAWPAFARFCQRHRGHIVETLAATTVQTTFVDRCAVVLPGIAHVAEQAPAPLHLIEIGCSAGILLTLDSYAYAYQGHARLGAANAALTLTTEVIGDPPRHIPQIASRTGLDLRPLNARDPQDHRWIIAQTFPEFREQRRQLATALDIVAQTDIRMVAGNALETLPAILAQTPDPACIFHSVCLSYWTDAERTALDAMLMAASHSRVLYRVGNEPSLSFTAWNKGHDRRPQERPPASGELTIARYAGGKMDRRLVGQTDFHGPVRWIGWDNGEQMA